MWIRRMVGAQNSVSRDSTRRPSWSVDGEGPLRRRRDSKTRFDKLRCAYIFVKSVNATNDSEHRMRSPSLSLFSQ